jgi:HAE1 family hydrophobic/amphiphilic exporter-1
MRRITGFILQRPKGCLAILICLALLGLMAASDLQVDLLSGRSHPVFTITTALPDHGPQEVETLITRPLEDGLKGISGLRDIYSSSKAGRSSVYLKLDTKADLVAAAQQVRGRLRRLRGLLPKEANPPTLRHYNPESRPVAVLGLSGGKSLGEAAQWARNELLPLLRRIDGVADARLAGDPVPEILVECDPEKLRSLGLSISQVSMAVRSGHENLPAGDLSVGERRLSVRTASNLSTAKQVAELPISASPDGRVILAGDVARISATFRQPREIARLGEEPVVTLSIHKSWGADVGRLWGRVNEVLAGLPQSPEAPRVRLIYSQADYLDKSLSRLGNMAMVAGGAAALVLLLFLRSLGSTLAALLACPFSLLATCLLMRLLGLKLNLLALSGLALALGILVDNAVVVIEAVHHHWRSGKERLSGIISGVAEVARPVAFSTLTTVAAFLPLLAVSDRVRLYMGSFFWGMSLSLLASLAAALFLVPLLMLFLARPQDKKQMASISHSFGKLLDSNRRRPWLVMGVSLLFLALAAWQGMQLAYGGGSGLEVRGFRVIAVTKPGTHKKVTDAKLKRLMARLAGLPGIKNLHSRVWGNQGRITATFSDEAMSQGPAILHSARDLVKPEKDVRYHILPMGGGGEQSTLGLYLFGPHLGGLYRWQQKVAKDLAALPDVKDVIRRLGNPAPQMELRLKHQELASLGLDADQVARAARNHLSGPVALRLWRGEQEVEVRIKAQPLAQQGEASLRRVFVSSGGGRLIPLSELVKPRLVNRPSELFRRGYRRVVNFNLVLNTPDVLGVAEKIRRVFKKSGIPNGYDWELDEEALLAAKTRKEMLIGAGLALLLVYLVIVAASESLAGPLVVMAAAPFALGGAVLALILFQVPVTMPVYLGAIILAGLLVNTGLVMIDAMVSRLGRGQSPQEAARSGAMRRLRPVLMSALTTIAAALPLLLDQGAGAGAWAPLALTCAAGVLGSSGFALIITPLLFPAAARLDAWLKGVKPGPAKSADSAGAPTQPDLFDRQPD